MADVQNSAELWRQVRETRETLATHLGECRESNRAFGRDIQGLRKVVWWAGTFLIGGQLAVIVGLLKIVFHW